jgi:hypothetical protein
MLHDSCGAMKSTTPHMTTVSTPPAIHSPSPPRGRLPLLGPPFLYPPYRRHRTPFLSLPHPRPFSNETEPPIPLTSCPPRPPAPSPFHWEIEAATTTSTPHGELPPLAIVALRHWPLLTPRPTHVLEDPLKLTADHQSPPLQAASPSPHRTGEPRSTSPCPAPPRRPPGAHRKTSSSAEQHRAAGQCATTCAPCTMAAPWAVSLAGLDRQAETVAHSAAQHCSPEVFIFFIFIYYSKNLNKFQKSIENTVKLGKIRSNFL